MFRNVLTEEQLKLLPLIKQFKRDYFMVGGTAIALQVGHRYSVDFDLFTFNKVQRKKIKNQITKAGWSSVNVIYEEEGQLHLNINQVKLTFFEFIYPFEVNSKFDDIIKIPDLLTLAAMKAFALGDRAKWKDYVDLYFLLKKYHFNEIAGFAEKIFSGLVNPKLFKEQLSYFKDIDYSEEVVFLPGFERSEKEIKDFLTDISLEAF